MRIGVVRERKAVEGRVALTPTGVQRLVARGHSVLAEHSCGIDSGWSNSEYEAAGAKLLGANEVWSAAELLLKVKEPIAEEYRFLRDGLILFTYLHLAPNPALTSALVRSGIRAIAYETVRDAAGGLPLLRPMSEIAGRLASQAAADCLRATDGGPGMLTGGIPGVAPAKFLIIGGGVVGDQAAQVAVGMGAEVTVLERSLDRIRFLEERWRGRVRLLMSDEMTLDRLLPESDAVIGAVLLPGAMAPRLIGKKGLAAMKPGSVMVDVAIDQGGCFETSRPTTHDDPTYFEEGVQHYCVANMPGAVPITATSALTQATLPFIVALADDPERALEEDRGLAAGLNVDAGEVLNPEVAEAFAAQSDYVSVH